MSAENQALKWFPVQIGFIPPFMLVDPDYSIYGLRFGFILGENIDVFGLDFGFVHWVRGRMYGLQFAFVNFANDVNGTDIYGAEIISDYVVRMSGDAPYEILDPNVVFGQSYGLALESASVMWISWNTRLKKWDFITQSFILTTPVPAGSYGLTWFNDTLYAANFAEDRIFMYDSNGTLKGSLPAPFSDTREVLTNGSALFAYSQNSHLLYSLDPNTGAILSSTDLPSFTGGVAQALTFHNGNILVYGLQSNSIYRYSVISEPIPEPSTIILMSCGLLGLLGIGVKRRRKAK